MTNSDVSQTQSLWRFWLNGHLAQSCSARRANGPQHGTEDGLRPARLQAAHKHLADRSGTCWKYRPVRKLKAGHGRAVGQRGSSRVRLASDAVKAAGRGRNPVVCLGQFGMADLDGEAPVCAELAVRRCDATPRCGRRRWRRMSSSVKCRADKRLRRLVRTRNRAR